MFYKYKVNCYDSYVDEEKPDEGIVYADSYGTAAEYVLEDYGKDSVIDMYLCELFEDGHCLTFDDIRFELKE